MLRTFKIIDTSAAAATSVGLAPLLSAAAEQPSPVAPESVSPGSDLESGRAAAIGHDLRLADAQAAGRLRIEAVTPVVEKRPRSELEVCFAGTRNRTGSARLRSRGRAATVVPGEGIRISPPRERRRSI